jgi:carboxyl-terminal processing protease
MMFTIDKDPVYDLALSGVEQKLRGPVGSEVRLVLRRAAEKQLDLTLKREADKLQTVVGRVEGGNVGYLRIAGFDGGAQAALAAALQDNHRGCCSAARLLAKARSTA